MDQQLKPGLLALDFDGVLCDGIDEMVETSWRTLAEVLGHEPPASRRAELNVRFAALRPAIESGWEMVVLLGILVDQPASADAGLRDTKRWAEVRDAYVHGRALMSGVVARTFDRVRERWIAHDRDDWLRRHRFYEGIAPWLSRLVTDGQLVYVISTKGKPFIEALLGWQKVMFPAERIFGRSEPRRAKWDVLRELAASHGVKLADVWFVEDRLATLVELRQHAPDFIAARLFLADWGYVFLDRDPDAARAAGVPVLSLAQFTGPFERWS